MSLLIDMIAVGQGDSFLLTLDGKSGEQFVLIDAGLSDSGTAVLEYLNQYAPTGLSLVIATHLDNDHVGGLATVLSHAKFVRGAVFALNVPLAISQKWSPMRDTLYRYNGIIRFRKLVEAVDAAQTLSAIASQRGLALTSALAGQGWSYGEVVLNVLNPSPTRLAAAWEESDLDRYINGNWAPQHVSIAEMLTDAPQTSAENDSSVVIEVTNAGMPCALMTSDAGAGVLREVTAGKRYAFLKVPHHGSRTGLDRELVQQIAPKTAFIPVGDNQHGHPDIEILNMLREVGAKTYCSSKTKDCRKTCVYKGGNISFPIGRSLRSGWTTIDASQCDNNITR